MFSTYRIRQNKSKQTFIVFRDDYFFTILNVILDYLIFIYLFQSIFVCSKTHIIRTLSGKINNFKNTTKKTQKHRNKIFILTLFLNLFQLQKPRDSKVTEFWVDFNINSSTISAFVNDDNSEEVSAQWTPPPFFLKGS